MSEPTLEQVEEKLAEIIDKKCQAIYDMIKLEIDDYSMNTPGHEINKALRTYFQ